MKHAIFLVLALCCSGPAIAQTHGIEGIFRLEGGSCSGEPGSAGAPAKIMRTEMIIGSLRCDFISHTPVSRMDGELRDANCEEAGRRTQTRFFLSQTRDGVVLMSRAFGLQELSICR
ncbi:unnamed protein product [Chrysoparadoxa australica]